MILFLKKLIWELYLEPDWYFVAIDKNSTMRPLKWNGKCWENRTECFEDSRISKIGGRVPQAGA